MTLLPSVNALIARGMFCGAKYTHRTFTPIIKHLITTTANKHSGKKSFIDLKKYLKKKHEKFRWHQANVGGKSVTCVFIPSQPVRLYQGDIHGVRVTLYSQQDKVASLDCKRLTDFGFEAYRSTLKSG